MASVSHRGDGTNLPATDPVTAAIAAAVAVVQAEVDATTAELATFNTRITALENRGGGGGSSSASKLINILDYSGSVASGDWAPAFAAAISAAQAGGYRGVFVPASTSAYTVKKPGSQTPSIDLRGLTDFWLVGEGPGSVIRMSGSGGAGSWFMIHVGSQASNILIRDITLDGDYTNLTNLDAGQQSHLIKIGGSNSNSGGASHVKVLNCYLKNSPGDGVAILPTSGAYGGTTQVSDVTIFNCRFDTCTRSGVSDQRSAQYVKIINNHFEGTSDQDIDFEPTGSDLATGTRRYLISGNTVIHGNSTACITLSGIGGVIPAQNNIFAHNQVYGGHVGVVNGGNAVILGNYIEGDITGDVEPILKIEGNCTNMLVAENSLVRPVGAVAGQVLTIQSRSSALTFAANTTINAGSDTLTFTGHALDTGIGPVRMTSTATLPAGLSTLTNYWVIRVDNNTIKLATTLANAMAGTAVDITDNGTAGSTHSLTVVYYPQKVAVVNNTIQTYVAGSAGVKYLVQWTNPQGCSFRGNTVESFSGTTQDGGVYWGSTSAVLLTLSHNRCSDNHFNGAAGNGGLFTSCVIWAPTGVAFSDTKTNHNSFQGCTNQIDYNIGTAGAYARTFTFTADAATDLGTTSSAHGLLTGAGAVRLTTTNTLPAGLSTATDYWVVKSTSTAVKFATSYANAMSITTIDITDAGTGIHTIQIPDHPFAVGNGGDGADFLNLSNIKAVQTSGNVRSIGTYRCSGSPNGVVTAVKASNCQRSDGAATTLLYVNTDGAGAWTAYA